jgi:hypothetical protein
LKSRLRKLEAEVQHVLRRAPAASALGDAQARGRARQAIDRLYISNYGHRFKFSTLQGRFSAFIDLWDRGLRAREEGRPGPFAQPRPPVVEKEKEKKPLDEGIVNVTTFKDPTKEMEKLQELHTTLSEARRRSGQDAIPFQKFAELIKTQVSTMKEKGHGGSRVSRGGEGWQSHLHGAWPERLERVTLEDCGLSIADCRGGGRTIRHDARRRGAAPGRS